jgi:hypothetical protein
MRNSEIHYLQGLIYYHSKDYKKAIEFFTNAIDGEKFDNNKQKEIYYYDRALALEKLLGKGDQESVSDYETSASFAALGNNKKLSGNHTHLAALHKSSHSQYCTLTSESLWTSYSSLQAGMKAELNLPYTVGSKAAHLETSFSLNDKKYLHAISIGFVGLEVGAYKRLYGRTEMAFNILNGHGTPFSWRTALGYNIKLSSKDNLIIRPEIGYTYLNRQILVDNISFEGTEHIIIVGHDFKYIEGNKGKTDEVQVDFCENTSLFSPSLGFWFKPYSSRLVLRLNAGYNFSFYQKSTMLFVHNNGGHLREDLNQLNITYTNTGENNKNFFRYQGFFAGVGIGILFN